HAPPDLAARIVGPDGQLIAKPIDPVLASMPEAPPVVTRPPVIDLPAEFAGDKKTVKRGADWSIAAVLTIAAGFVGVVVAIGIMARLKSPQPDVAHEPAPAKDVAIQREPDVIHQPVRSEEFAAAPPKTEIAIEPPAPLPAPANVAVTPPSPDTNPTSQLPKAQR